MAVHRHGAATYRPTKAMRQIAQARRGKVEYGHSVAELRTGVARLGYVPHGHSNAWSSSGDVQLGEGIEKQSCGKEERRTGTDLRPRAVVTQRAAMLCGGLARFCQAMALQGNVKTCGGDATIGVAMRRQGEEWSSKARAQQRSAEESRAGAELSGEPQWH